MLSLQLTQISQLAAWEAIVARYPAAHLLQSWPWGELKSRFGWGAVRLWVEEAGAAAQVLFRKLPLGLSVAYIPKGPLLDWEKPAAVEAFLQAAHSIARRRRAIFLKIEPDVSDDRAPDLTRYGFRHAPPVQPRRTSVISISGSEAEILAGMKQKTRYNIRLAGRKRVTIRPGTVADLPVFYELSQITARRNGFGIHRPAYYRTAFEVFPPERRALLLAEFEGQPLAALMVFAQGKRAYYLYGASNNLERQRMPAYLLQWEAIRWARRAGCTTYDLWGVPDADEATLEANFRGRQDGLWGVYRFKRGFGGQLVRSAGAFDYVYNWPLYRLYDRFTRRGAA
ncbi:MAG: lipid II:glycine glycyltransferase FemX [Anaerolineae bacterium]